MAEMKRPRISVLIGGIEYASSVQSFTVTADLREPAVTCELLFEDLLRTRVGQIQRALPLTFAWGYDGESMQRVFQGVVRDVDDGRNPLRVQGIDFNTLLAAKRITATYQDESAEGILRAVLANTGLSVQAESSGVQIDRLPLFNVTLRDAMDTLTAMVRKQTGQPWYDFIRDGVFHWGPPNYSQDPAHAFRTGVDVLAFRKASAGLSALETLIVPVNTADVVTVDGFGYFVIRAEYRWLDGGRMVLGLEACP